MVLLPGGETESRFLGWPKVRKRECKNDRHPGGSICHCFVVIAIIYCVYFAIILFHHSLCCLTLYNMCLFKTVFFFKSDVHTCRLFDVNDTRSRQCQVVAAWLPKKRPGEGPNSNGRKSLLRLVIVILWMEKNGKNLKAWYFLCHWPFFQMQDLNDAFRMT